MLSGTDADGSSGPISGGLYGEADAGAVPAESLKASLGCGNLAALAQLRPGEVVLDLGSGGGIDVLPSARRVGPSGKPTAWICPRRCLTLSEQNKARSGLANVEFIREISRASRSRTRLST